MRCPFRPPPLHSTPLGSTAVNGRNVLTVTTSAKELERTRHVTDRTSLMLQVLSRSGGKMVACCVTHTHNTQFNTQIRAHQTQHRTRQRGNIRKPQKPNRRHEDRAPRESVLTTRWHWHVRLERADRADQHVGQHQGGQQRRRLARGHHSGRGRTTNHRRSRRRRRRRPD